jgi:hypothetical protein
MEYPMTRIVAMVVIPKEPSNQTTPKSFKASNDPAIKSSLKLPPAPINDKRIDNTKASSP